MVVPAAHVRADLTVLVSLGCCNKLPKTITRLLVFFFPPFWIKKSEIHDQHVRVPFLKEGVGGFSLASSYCLMSSGNLWFFLTCVCVNLCCLHIAFSQCNLI